jgi:hypothetical protein
VPVHHDPLTLPTSFLCEMAYSRNACTPASIESLQ